MLEDFGQFRRTLNWDEKELFHVNQSDSKNVGFFLFTFFVRDFVDLA